MVCLLGLALWLKVTESGHLANPGPSFIHYFLYTSTVLYAFLFLPQNNSHLETCLVLDGCIFLFLIAFSFSASFLKNRDALSVPVHL